ncbi:MAG: BatA domain-containing protein, partial [Gemmatimonadales bacterium]
MPLGFLVPAFLLAGLAIAVPVYLHLRHRERREPVRFPSLMFLARLPHRTSDRRRLTHLLLLALRAAAIILLAIAFARPFVEQDSALSAERAARDVVVVADRSMSMGYAGAWAAARDSVRRLMGGLVPGDRAALVLVDEGAEVAVPLGGDGAAVVAAFEA